MINLGTHITNPTIQDMNSLILATMELDSTHHVETRETCVGEGEAHTLSVLAQQL